MEILNTKLGKIYKSYDKSYGKFQELYWKRNTKYVEMVNDVHSSNIPNEIRNTEMNFDFNTDFSDLKICC